MHLSLETSKVNPAFIVIDNEVLYYPLPLNKLHSADIL